MNKIFLFFLSIFFTMMLFPTCKVMEKKASSDVNHGVDNFLVAYGAQIYEREKCSKCHTQQIDKKRFGLVSLDGFANKYSNLWIYNYLADPKSMIATSKMPSYIHLLGQSLDKKIYETIVREKGSSKQKTNIDLNWNGLIHQADSISKNYIVEDMLLKSRTEVLALIAYLQEIPATKSKLKLDSLENVKYLEKGKMWDNLVLDENSIVMKTAHNKNNIKKGKRLYQDNCVACHGQQGEGGIGSNLTDDYWLEGGSDIEIAKSIIYGIPKKGMISWREQFTPIEVGELMAFLFSIKGTKPENAKEPQGKKEN